MKESVCSECNEPVGSGMDVCEDCCDHDYDPGEGYMCLNCGREGLEDAMAAAYDRAKDSRYE